MQNKLFIVFVLAPTIISLVLVPAKPYKILEYTQPQAELYVGRTSNRNVYDPVNITCEYEPCETFTVYIKTRNITDLWGVTFYMNYDPIILNCTDVRYGASWGVFGVDYLRIPGTINRTKGSIEAYDAARMTAAVSVNATLFEVDFHFLDYGQSTLQINGTPIEMLDEFDDLITVPITDGYFSCPPAHDPTAVFTYRPLVPSTNDMIAFNASASLPGFNGTAEVPIANYTWDFDDGNITTVMNPVIYHAFTSASDYNVNLTVTCKDDPTLIAKGLTLNSTSKIITIICGPTAAFTYSPYHPIANWTTTFNASVSLSGWKGTEEALIVNYTWEFGDGANATEADPITEHVYTTVGNYNVTLTVVDSQGLNDTTSKTITVMLEVHDIAVINKTTFSSNHGPPGSPYTPVTECYPTWTVEINVTVQNQGTITETFTVQAFYGNSTGNYTTGISPTSYSVTLIPGAVTSKVFTWDAPDIPKVYPYPTYTIYANVSVVSGETDTADNTRDGVVVTVKWIGDANGDGSVSLKDLSALARSYRKSPGDPNYNPQADYSGDGGQIGLKDLSELASKYNKGPLDP